MRTPVKLHALTAKEITEVEAIAFAGTNGKTF